MSLHVQTVRGGGSYATSQTRAMGTNAEKRFASVCVRRGLQVLNASYQENVFNHYDFTVTLPDGARRRVDVKAIKSRQRGQPPDPSVVFVEMRGVTGKAGWIYGHADYIAFEQPNGFFIVPRQALLKRAETLSLRCVASNVSGVPMTMYSRRGRNDSVLVFDIRHIADIQGSFLLT